MKKNVKNRIIIGGIVGVIICSVVIGIFVQRNNVPQLAKEDSVEKQALTETKEFTEDDFPYNIKFKDIAVGYNFAIALDEEGHLWTWGNGTNANDNRINTGTLGDGISRAYYWRDYPKKISDIKFSKIYATYYSAFAIDEEGFLYAWGTNDNYQLGDGTKQNKVNPIGIKSNL